MALFGLLGFGRHSVVPEAGNRFGRYADAWKSPEQMAWWRQAQKAWEEQRYLDSVEALLHYLLDPARQNVQWTRTGTQIHFTLLQGSKVVHGQADDERLRAESRVAHTRQRQVACLRRLLEANADLNFSRFALDGQEHISLVTSSFLLDGSPWKLYHALRELAVNADKQDDLLLDEFDQLEPVEMEHVEPLSAEEKAVRYDFFVQEIRRTFALLDSGALPPEQYPAAASYLLLGLVYRLDYLVKPEGYTMETFERLHRDYFTNDGRTVQAKNRQLRRELEALLERPREELYEELYLVPATFGITEAATHDLFVNFIGSELPHMEWYLEHDHPRFALAIPDYIAGYSLFNHALPPPDRDLLHLYWCVRAHQYFAALGLEYGLVDRASGRLNGAAIRRAVQAICRRHREHYPELEPPVRMLHTNGQTAFARSFLQMMARLDLTPRE